MPLLKGLVSAGMWLAVGLVLVSVALQSHAAEARSASAQSSTQGVLHAMGLGAGQHLRIVETHEDGAGLDISPHFRWADSNVDSTLLDDLNNMLIQTQARAVREHCQLLGNWFGYVVQLTLGCLAFSALIVKKYLDSKPRDWMTWLRDTSKQAIGSIVAHMWNLLFATLLQQSNAKEDPCVYYLINYLVDVVLGCVLSLLLLWAVESLADKYQWDSLRSGDYGGDLSDQSTVWKRWAVQCSVWIGILTLAKLVCLFCLIVPAKRPLYVAGSWLMSGLVNYPRLELVIVMIIIPLVLNVVQFWVQDNFLMSADAHNTGLSKPYANANANASKSDEPPAGPAAAAAPQPQPHASPVTGPGAAADASVPSISVAVSGGDAADPKADERAGLLA